MISHNITTTTIYLTILSFNNPSEEGFQKALLEKTKMQEMSIFSFSHNLSPPSEPNLTRTVTECDLIPLPVL